MAKNCWVKGLSLLIVKTKDTRYFLKCSFKNTSIICSAPGQADLVVLTLEILMNLQKYFEGWRDCGLSMVLFWLLDLKFHSKVTLEQNKTAMDQHPNPRVQTLPVQQSHQQVGSRVIFSRRTSAWTGSVFGLRRTGEKNAEREVFSFFFFHFRGRMDWGAYKTTKNKILLASGNRHNWKLEISQSLFSNWLCEQDHL